MVEPAHIVSALMEGGGEFMEKRKRTVQFEKCLLKDLGDLLSLVMGGKTWRCVWPLAQSTYISEKLGTVMRRKEHKVQNKQG